LKENGGDSDVDDDWEGRRRKSHFGRGRNAMHVYSFLK